MIDGAKKVTDDPGVVSPVVISNVSASSPLTGFMQVTWQTNIPATTQLYWGVAPNMDQVSPTVGENDTNPLSTSHVYTAIFVGAGKMILFQCRSRQAGGRDGMNNSVLDGYYATYNGSVAVK